jgi:hypothetical protein
LLRVQLATRSLLPKDLAQVSAVTQTRAFTVRGGCGGAFIPGICMLMVDVVSHSPSFMGGVLGNWNRPESRTPPASPALAINNFMAHLLRALDGIGWRAA